MSRNDGYRQNELDSLPFVQLPLAILADTELTAGPKLAYCVLLRFAFQKSICFPSIKRIAALLGISESSSRRQIGDLVKRGLLKIEPRTGESNVYNREGCAEAVYCEKGGFLTDKTIKMLLKCGEKRVVLGLKAERHEVIELMKAAGAKDIPDEINVPGFGDEDISGEVHKQSGGAKSPSEPSPKPMLKSFEGLTAAIDSKNKETRKAVDGQKERREKRNNAVPDLEIERAKREAKEAEKLQRAADGTLLTTKDLEDEWRIAVERKYPAKKVYVRWNAKQRGQAMDLGDYWGYEDTIRAFKVIVSDWEEYMDRYGIRGYPSLGAVAGYANTWFPEALGGTMEPKTAGGKAMAEGEYDGRASAGKGGLLTLE